MTQLYWPRQLWSLRNDAVLLITFGLTLMMPYAYHTHGAPLSSVPCSAMLCSACGTPLPENHVAMSIMRPVMEPPPQ